MTDDPAVIEVLRSAVPAASIDAAASTDMPTLFVDREHLLEVLVTLRDDPALQFALLSDLTAVDLYPAEPRYEVVYHLACLGAAFAAGRPAPARRLRVKVRLSGQDHVMPSVTGIYPAANWPEREVFDLFGIGFSEHPDLRRILTAEDWTGHPLRKDYPVQVRKTPQAWSPIQVSAEEFAEHIRAQREKAKREIEAESPRD